MKRPQMWRRRRKRVWNNRLSLRRLFDHWYCNTDFRTIRARTFESPYQWGFQRRSIWSTSTPDAVRWKASGNVVCSCFKWIAFGILIGTGTQKFLLELYENQCYNTNGQKVVSETIGYFILFCVACATSAVASLAEAPFSAYYGGKLVGVPYVKWTGDELIMLLKIVPHEIVFRNIVTVLLLHQYVL
jgi:hypothetical protein